MSRLKIDYNNGNILNYENNMSFVFVTINLSKHKLIWYFLSLSNVTTYSLLPYRKIRGPVLDLGKLDTVTITDDVTDGGHGIFAL